ncbi:hypothetical protein C0J50_21382 [Silurus asotus]|uniref:Uncharacterized protein n=1 Tax=Silurus asotus TaxID=30991 RepID=A0AAD5ANA7_SILAS|nr:hypothetical protein C0J50_21382 [Silurus asotus]
MLLEHPGSSCQNPGNFSRYSSGQGFTALTEKYTAMHEEVHGADELTNKLNQFISRLVIWDAILAQWLVEGLQMSDVISLAVKCALKIQKECDLQEEKHDSELHVKIAISAGKLSKIIVGNKLRRFFVITGPAVDEVRMNESLANPGDIILSTETMKLCDQKNMVIRHTAHKKAVKMLRFKKEPRFSVGTYYQMLAKDQKIPEKVMGTKVNLAARLMVYYPGIVSCDWETRYYSGLPSCCFKEEIAKDLKGVSQPGKIYRFDPSHQRHDHDALQSLEIEKDSMVGDMHRTLTELNVLSAAEGLILRHAAFLGQKFTTKMLHNILPDPLQEKLNSILTTLFQLGIFKCASKPPKDSSAMTVEKPKLVCYCGSSSTGSNTGYVYMSRNDTENFLDKLDKIVNEKQARMSTSLKCKCAQLLEMVLIPIVRHWSGAEDISKTFYYLLECAAMCTNLSDNPRAMRYLKEAKRILENLKEGKSDLEDHDSVQIAKSDQAVMFKLIGEMLFTAMDYHQYSQFMNDKSKCKCLEAWLCRMCSGLSNCTENQRLINRLARTLAIVHLCRGNLKESADFTIRAQHLDGVRFDARTIGILHLALLFTGRWVMVSVTSASALKQCRIVTECVEFNVCRYKEGMQLIYKLETLSSEMLSIVAKGWFYAACLNILLYAGISLRPLEEFLDFVKESQSDVNLVADKSLMMHLYFSLALWFARLNDWENFTVFYDKAFGMYIQIPPTIYSISGVAVFLECNVLLFKQELVKFNRPCMKAYERTLQLFTDFRHCFGGDHIFVPRVLHLNAFLNQLVGKTTLVENLLMDALQLSEKQGNLLDNTQIKHSQVITPQNPNAASARRLNANEKCLTTF